MVASLGKLAAARGIFFGSAFDVEAVDTPAYGRLLRHHARFLTTSNSLKFQSVRWAGPQQAADFRDADRIMAFAGATGAPVCGHTLIWNEWMPKWFAAQSASRRAYWLDRHIDEVCGRYAGRMYSWDVVNEPFWPEHGNPDGMRGGPWYAAMGPGYIARAFKRAGAADPKAKLALNESGAEWAGARAQIYRKGILKTIRQIRDAGGRIDIVGLQCHVTRLRKFDPNVFEDFVGRLGEERIEVFVTELDVNDSDLPDDIAARDRAVAARYRSIVQTALKCPNVKGIVTWDLADSFSWYRTAPGASRRLARPLPFDASFNPKPAYTALVQAFSAPPTADKWFWERR